MATSALMNTYGEHRLTLTKGRGMYVWDNRGRRYLDALGGIAVCGLGHCHPAVTAAIALQADTLVHVSNLYLNEQQLMLAEKLCKVSGMDRVFFSNSGAEANEAAIKLARKYGNQRGVLTPTVLTMSGCFHGRTMATLTATGGKKVTSGFSPLVPGFLQVPYNDLPAVEAAARNHPEIVAILVEPIQGEGGIRVPDEHYLTALRAICDAHQWLLMLDEIQTGNGRTGRMFAFQHHALKPDVVTTAKGLGNGAPIGACLAHGEAADILQPGNHGSTYGGNPLVCSAALSVLETLEADNLPARASDIGAQMLRSLRDRLENHALVKEIRGKGLMLAVELHRDCGELVERARDRGLLINVTAGSSIRLLPALIIDSDQAQQIVDTVCDLIEEL